MNCKRKQPVAVCTVCHTFTTRADAINQQCDQRPDGKRRCRGIFGSALNENDWKECPRCGATGEIGNKSCDDCNGEGWTFMRKRWRHCRRREGAFRTYNSEGVESVRYTGLKLQAVKTWEDSEA